MAIKTALELAAALRTFDAEHSKSLVRIACGPNLYLVARKGKPDTDGKRKSTKSWVLRYGSAKTRTDMGLGSYPEVGLGDARARAEGERQKLRCKIDPLEARRAAEEAKRQQAALAKVKAITMEDACKAVIGAKRSGWSNVKHAKQWTATFEAYVFPTIGPEPVADVSIDDVLRVLRPIWTDKPETASRVRQRMEAALDLAKTRGWRSGENPARWRSLLSHELPAPTKVRPVKHHPALPWSQIGRFMEALTKMDGMGATALQFAILTAARTGEVRGARWREFDLVNRVWNVPAGRMKARRLHRVPLSEPAMAILHALHREAQRPDGLVFPGSGGAKLSGATVAAVIRRMNEAPPKGQLDLPRWCDHEGRPVVPHGLRSTFRDWAGETRSEGRDVTEMCLAHSIRGKSEASYARGDLLEKRRILMDAWGEYCMPGAKDTVAVPVTVNAR